jgi:hypothetical protein
MLAPSQQLRETLGLKAYHREGHRMANWFFALFGIGRSPQQPTSPWGASTFTAVGGVNLFVGRWQGTSNAGIYSDVVFTADGKFSAILEHGAMQRIGSYRIMDDRTIFVVDDPAIHVQFLPGSHGQPVAREIRVFPQETNYYEFPDPQTLIMRSSIAPVFTRYTRVS